MTRSALIILLALAACSPERKLNRLLMKYPELRDTVTYTDTVTAIVEYVKGDTVFVSTPGDTVTMTRDRLTVRYVERPGDTVWIDGACQADTVIRVVSRDVPVVQPVRNVYRVPWWAIAAIVALTVAVLGLIWRR